MRLKDPEAFRKMMRIWWEQNKEAFLKKDYKAVKPVSLAVEPTAAPVPPSQPEPAVIAAPEPTPSSVPTPVVSTPQENGSSSWFLIVAGVVLAALAGTGLFWLLKKPSA